MSKQIGPYFITSDNVWIPLCYSNIFRFMKDKVPKNYICTYDCKKYCKKGEYKNGN